MALWPMIDVWQYGLFLVARWPSLLAILLTGSSPAAAGPAVLLGPGRPLLRRLLGSGSSGLRRSGEEEEEEEVEEEELMISISR